jgi:hypothetical protein
MKKKAKEIKEQSDKKRNYKNDYPSVTEILSMLRKVGLEMWYKYNDAKVCDEKSKKGKEIGTQIHDLIQSYIQGKEPRIETVHDKEVSVALESFFAFRRDNPTLTFIDAEKAITNDTSRFNGTIDCICLDNGKTGIIDWKTGECKEKDFPSIYPEYLLQLAAYTFLYETDQQRKIDFACLVVLSKDKPTYLCVDIGMELLYSWMCEIFFPLKTVYTHLQSLNDDMKKYFNEFTVKRENGYKSFFAHAEKYIKKADKKESGHEICFKHRE